MQQSEGIIVYEPDRKWDLRFLALAKHVSQWSKDPSTQCGAVVVSPDRSIVLPGYNGFPRGMDDNRSLYTDRETKCARVIHAEMNAILSSSQSVRGWTLYVWPLMSCPRCSVHIIQAGIKRCVSVEASSELFDRWDLGKSLEFFDEAGVEWLTYD